MSKPIYRVLGRPVKGFGYLLLERCGKMIRIKSEGKVWHDWCPADPIFSRMLDYPHSKHFRKFAYDAHEKYLKA